MTYDVELLFICLLVISMSSLVRCLVRCLVHFLIKLFVFLLLYFKSSMYILDNGSLPDVSFASILSYPVAFLFILLSVSFVILSFYSFIYLFIRLHWVFIAEHGLSLVAVSGGYSLL